MASPKRYIIKDKQALLRFRDWLDTTTTAQLEWVMALVELEKYAEEHGLTGDDLREVAEWLDRESGEETV